MEAEVCSVSEHAMPCRDSEHAMPCRDCLVPQVLPFVTDYLQSQLKCLFSFQISFNMIAKSVDSNAIPKSALTDFHFPANGLSTV